MLGLPEIIGGTFGGPTQLSDDSHKNMPLPLESLLLPQELLPAIGRLESQGAQTMWH